MDCFSERKLLLKLAIARNTGRRILPNWIQEFEIATGYSINKSDFLDLIKTEELKNRCYNRMKELRNNQMVEWQYDSFDEVIDYLVNLDIVVGSVTAYLLSDVDEYIGALLTESSSVFNNVRAIWEIVHNDLVLITQDSIDGICLEFNYYSNNGKYNSNGFYQLTSWGRFALGN